MIRILIALLLISGAVSAQNFPQTIVGKQRFTDSVQMQRFKNNVAMDSVLSTDTSGKIRMKKVVGTGAAVDTIYRVAGKDSIFYIIGGITHALKDSTGTGGGSVIVSDSAWSLTGNSGTNPASNFIGTTDAQKFVIKTNSSKALTINTNGALGLGTGEDYGTSGYALVTNGSSTAPTWHNIQDGWFNIVRDGGADTTGATDVSTIIQGAMANGWRNIFIPKGLFLISTQIQMHDSVTIMGAGRFSSIFKLTTDIAAFKCAIPSGGSQTTFSDIGFYGTYATGGGTSQMGISIDTAQKILIKSISGTNIGGFVVSILRNGYNGPYIDIAGKSNEITDSYFEANYGGVSFGTRGEYNTISNSTFTQNLYAIYNTAGNSRINGNTCVNNTYGLYMTSGSNNGHGVATGNTFNHNGGGGVGANIYLSNLNTGFSFVNNTWVQSRNANAGLIEIVSCANVYFYGGFTSNDTVRTTGCTNIAFDNVEPYVAAASPIWINVSGSAPTVSYIGRIQNTFSLRDVANSNQLDITHTNSKVNFTGTSGIKFGFLNAAADSTVDITGSLKASGGVRFTGLIAGLADTTTFNPVGINSSGTLARMASWPAGSGGSGVTTMAAIGSSPNANGATISGSTLNLEPASASFGGVVTTATQALAGAKTFSSIITASAGIGLPFGSGTNKDTKIATYDIGVSNYAGIVFSPLTGTNVGEAFAVSPKGTGFSSTNMAQFAVYNTDVIADATNTEFFGMRSTGSTGYVIGSGKTGTGSNRDMMFAAGWFTNGTTNANQLLLSTNGNVSLVSLAGTGSRTVLADASGVLSAPVSDSTTKYDIVDLDYGINTLMKLHPVSFKYKKDWQRYGTGKQIGFIAQEVWQVLPNSTFITPTTGKMGYNEIDLIPVLTKAIQQQQQQINELKAEIIKLQNK